MKVFVCEDLLSGRVWLRCKIVGVEVEKWKASKNVPTAVKAVPGTDAR